MLLDYASNYGEPEEQPQQPVWIPRKRRRAEPEPVAPEQVPEPQPREIVRATMDAAVPMLRVQMSARATVEPPTDIRDIDLDSMEDGWTDERLLIAAALAVLDDEDD